MTMHMVGHLAEYMVRRKCDLSGLFALYLEAKHPLLVSNFEKSAAREI
jgi:hypothetical protein